ncbi:MAG: ABC-type transport auxiliary lipoprotein family protein [Wenzhouxiangella sp.]
MKALFGVFGLVLCLGLSGCGLTRPLDPVSVLAPEIELRSDPAWPEVDWGVQVRRPVTDRMRDSERLFVRVGGSRLQAYPGAVWLDQAPDLIQTLTIQALQDSGRFQAAGRAGALRSRFALDTEIRRFDAVDTGAADLSVELVVTVRLVAQRTGQALATRTIEVSEQSTGTQLDPLVAAFERALAGYFAELLPWILEEGQIAAEELAERPRFPRGDRGSAER